MISWTSNLESALSIVGIGVGVALLTAGAILSVVLPVASAPVMTIVGAITFVSSWASVSYDVAPTAQSSASLWAKVREIPKARNVSEELVAQTDIAA